MQRNQGSLKRSARYSLAAATICAASAAWSQTPNLQSLKAEAVADVDAHATLVGQIVDSVFSFGEPAYQEYETGKYVGGILKQHGFTVKTDIAGMPTGWVATWSNGTGKPVISLNNDEDDLLGLSQMPGVLKHEPIVAGAPGHGEGHNTGVGGMVVAAIVLEDVMKKHNISGTIQVWPGIAEEVVGGKGYFAQAGVFKNVDAVLSTHVSSGLSTSYGRDQSTGMVSVIYSFNGKTAHAGGEPWLAHSALAAAEMFDTGIQYQRQFFKPGSRTHDVILNGGLEPNVVPDHTTVWYYFRANDPDVIHENYATGTRVAKDAADMFQTTTTNRLIGAAYPGFDNKPLAEDMQKNMEAVGMPKWSQADITYAKNVQTWLHFPVVGLATAVSPISPPATDPHGGFSDDIGDVMWRVPTLRLMYPSNIPGVPFHTWEAALAEATPIAHKGAVVDAKVLAMTALDLYLEPKLLEEAKNYFLTVQKAPETFHPFLTPEDKPDIHMYDAVMKEYRPLMAKFYYNPKKYKSYLDQLGVKYP